MEQHWIRLNAGKDTNGNPRRCYVALNKNIGERQPVAAVVDEGYAGLKAVEDAFGAIHAAAASRAPTFATTVKQYKELLRNYPNRASELVMARALALLPVPRSRPERR